MRLGIVVGVSALVVFVGIASAEDTGTGKCGVAEVTELLKVCQPAPRPERPSLPNAAWICVGALGAMGIIAWGATRITEIIWSPSLEKRVAALEKQLADGTKRVEQPEPKGGAKG